MPTALTGAGNFTSATASTAGSLTIAKPSNVANGDLLVAHVRFQNSGQTISSPAGWTSVNSFTTNWSHAVFIKYIPTASAETATDYAFTVASGTARWVGAIFRVTGADSGSPIQATGTYSSPSGTTTCVIPSVTASASGLLLALEVTNLGATGGSGVAFTPPAGMTTVGSAYVDNGSQTSSVWVGQETLSAAGATGTRTISHSPSAANSGGLLVVVAGPNAAPTVSVSPTTQNVSAGATVNLTATATDDGTIASYSWAFTYPTSGAPTLTGGTTATPSFTAGSAGALYVITCTVTDNNGASTTSSPVEVRVPSSASPYTVVPTSGTGTGTWTNTGGASSEGAALNDGSDTTYLESPTLSGTATTHRMRRIPITTRTGYVFTERLALSSSGSSTVKVRCFQGATQIQEWTQAITTTPTDYTFTVTTPASITDPGNVFVEIYATS